MSDSPFVHLHCHSHYSLLDGAGSLDRLIDRAKSLGMNSLALTDHGNLYGALEFYQKAQAAGIKPIVGYEAYVAPGSRFHKDATSMKEASFHLTLLAMNRTGFKNLLKLSSAAFLEGFYFRPRIDKQLLQQHNEGLICLSGCASSELNRVMLSSAQLDLDRACEVADWFRSLFGDRYFIEIQNNGLEIQRTGIERSIEVAKRMNLPLVATSDVHYVNREDAPAQDILLCVNTGKFRTDAKRMKMDSDEFYLRGPQEMYAAFSGLEDAVRRSQEIADMVDIDLEIGARHFPIFTPPNGMSSSDYLRDLVVKGLKDRYKNIPERWEGDELSREVRDRIDRELGVINKLGFPNYFLIVWDYVHFARSQGIEATARGSGVGSVVSYGLYLSHVCPLKYDLLFERFLDESRKEAPDIDIDFDQQRRGEVIQYVKEKYGHDQVSQIGTFGTLAARAAIRDVGRALGLPIPRVNAVVAMVPEELHITIKSAIAKSDDLRKTYESDPEVKELLNLAMSVEGLARNVGTHAAAVVIADQPLNEYLPLQRVQGKEEVVTQWAMGDVEKAGLLKMDFLGLRNLTILSNVIKTIEQTTGKRVDPYSFPLDDKETYALLCRGETKGVFQLESGGIRDLLQRMKPNHFSDIIATNALYRPGPLEGGMVDDYIQIKHGRKQAEYPHPVMKEVLEETHGIMCIHEDARISLADGSERPIREVRLGNRVHALNLDSQRFEVKECHGCGPTRRGDGLEITLSNGFRVVLTPDHKVLTYDGFKEAQHLDPEKDLVATALELPQERVKTSRLAPWLGADADVAYFLGQLVGDGCMTGKGISLATGRRPDHLRMVRWLRDKLPILHLNPYHHMRSWFVGISCPILLDDPAHGNRKTRLHHWLETLGMKVTARGKHVPEPVFRAGPAVRQAFLAGLLDSDGCTAETNKGAAVCFLSSASPALLEDVRRLCQLEGIAVTLRKNRIQMWNLKRLKKILKPYLVLRKFKGTLHAGSTVGCAPRQAVFRSIGEGESERAFCRRTGIQRNGLHHDHPFVKSSTAAKAGIDLGDVRYFRIAEIRRVHDQQFYGMSVADHHNLVANGIVVKNCYQEQVMRILNRLGGIKLSNAYTCIKAISKKKLSMIAKFKEEFLEGAQTQGLAKDEAENLWNLIEKFAGYGFNKSHSTAYALIAYMTAYLKAHYPVEFMAALLTSDMPGRNFTKKDSLVEHLEDCQRMNIEVVPPDVNRCGPEFEVAEGKIFFGLGAIKGCGLSAAEAIVASRKAKGPFKDIFDFCERLDSGSVGRTAIESLVKAGAFDPMGARRAQLFTVIDKAMQSGASVAADRRAGQRGLFDDDEEEQTPAAVAASLPDVPEWEERDRLSKEKEVLNFYISSHPLAEYEKLLSSYCTHNTVEAAELKHRTEVLLGGMLSSIKFSHTKNPQPGKPSKYAMFDLEDMHGIMRTIIWPEQFAQFGELVQPDAILAVRGSIDKRPGSEEANFIVNELIPMTELTARYTRGMSVRVFEEQHGIKGVEQLYEILRGYPGSGELKILFCLADGSRVSCKCEKLRLEVNDEMRHRVEELLGPENVSLLAAPITSQRSGRSNGNGGNGRGNGRSGGRS